MKIQIFVGESAAENLTPDSAVFIYIPKVLHPAVHHCIYNALGHIPRQITPAHFTGTDTAETHTRTVGSRILMAKTNCSSIPAFVKHSPAQIDMSSSCGFTAVPFPIIRSRDASTIHTITTRQRFTEHIQCRHCAPVQHAAAKFVLTGTAIIRHLRHRRSMKISIIIIRNKGIAFCRVEITFIGTTKMSLRRIQKQIPLDFFPQIRIGKLIRRISTTGRRIFYRRHKYNIGLIDRLHARQWCLADINICGKHPP